MEDDGSHLVCGFQLAREAAFSQPSLNTYPSDRSVSLRKAVSAPEDPCNLRGRSSESYTNDRREDDVAKAEANRDIAPAGNMVVEGATARDGKAYTIDT